MNDSDSVKKLIMDSACKVALDEHLDEVNFNLKPQEHSYRLYDSNLRERAEKNQYHLHDGRVFRHEI